MLFDNEEQLEVRHVISLAHHAVSIYSGGDETPEGELFIKRNAFLAGPMLGKLRQAGRHQNHSSSFPIIAQIRRTSTLLFYEIRKGRQMPYTIHRYRYNTK
jgi:hypothetical protein